MTMTRIRHLTHCFHMMFDENDRLTLFLQLFEHIQDLINHLWCYACHGFIKKSNFAPVARQHAIVRSFCWP